MGLPTFPTNPPTTQVGVPPPNLAPPSWRLHDAPAAAARLPLATRRSDQRPRRSWVPPGGFVASPNRGRLLGWEVDIYHETESQRSKGLRFRSFFFNNESQHVSKLTHWRWRWRTKKITYNSAHGYWKHVLYLTIRTVDISPLFNFVESSWEWISSPLASEFKNFLLTRSCWGR